ncbi:hypothetical protein ACQ4WX_07985 [Streptomyces lasalocidi]
MQILQLLVSPAHRSRTGPATDRPSCRRATCDDSRGARTAGPFVDRYVNHPAYRNASITLTATERIPRLGPYEPDLLRTRRNILLRGVDIDACGGATVVLAAAADPWDWRCAARPGPVPG